MNTIIFNLIVGTVLGHSWLDCIGTSDIDYQGPEQYFSNDFYHKYCIGFPRAYPGRMNRNINTLFTHQVNNRGGSNHDAPVCATQDLAYTEEFPMAKVKAGANLKFWYEMDNHYKPLTQVHIFSHGKPDTKLVKYNEMSPATELFSHDFATTGNCMNVNNVNTFCWAYWKVPENWGPGTYSFLWNWRWDKNPSGEEYNSCFDIEVTSGNAHPTVVPQITQNEPQYQQNTTVAEPPSPSSDPATEALSTADPDKVVEDSIDVDSMSLEDYSANQQEPLLAASEPLSTDSEPLPPKKAHKCRRRPQAL